MGTYNEGGSRDHYIAVGKAGQFIRNTVSKVHPWICVLWSSI